MAAVPPLPPRRKVPVPPRRTSSVISQSPSDSVDTTPVVGGIAARIAALQLGQVVGGLGGPLPKRPPITRGASANPNTGSWRKNDHVGAEDTPVEEESCAQPSKGLKINGRAAPSSMAQALKRPPPPPPRPAPNEAEKEETWKPPLSRRVPTLPARRVSNQLPPDVPTQDDEETEDRTPPPPAARILPPPLRLRNQNAHVDASAPMPPPPVNRASRPQVPRSRPVIPVLEPTPEPEPEPEQEYYEDKPEAEPEAVSDSDAETCLKCRSFDVVDAHAACFPREEQHSLEHLAHDLTSPFKSVTDKARAIFTWLHHNIAYDTHSFFNNCVKPSTPESTLQSGLAVCEGYAGLFANIASHVGLHALVINGHGKGFGYVANESGEVPPFESNHAWNAVVLDDNRWHLIDSCWGSGAVNTNGYNKRFAPQWFTSTNEEFGNSHFPKEDGYQMREDGTWKTWSEYILTPAGPLELSHFNQLGYNHETLWPNLKYIAGGYQHTFHIEKQCWHMERRDWWEDCVLIIVVSKDGNDVNGERVVMDRDEEGGWTAKLDVPSGETMVTMFAVTSWDGQDAKGLDPGVVRSEWGRKAMAFQGIVRWEAR